jgi:hypothetical protein
MPNTTVNFALPYPAGTDAPCDFAEQWCDFTAAIDGVFDTFQSAIDRTIPVVPVAITLMTIPTSVFNSGLIPFDTVLVDTAGMTDMDTDPYTITIKRPGRYTVAAGILKPSTGAPPAPGQTSIFALPEFDAQAVVNDLGPGGGVLYYLAAYFAVETYAAGDQIQLSFSVGNQALWPITSAHLSVLWHSDTEVP